MKKNSILFAGSLLTSWLLYEQSLGINALLFTAILHLIVIIQSSYIYNRLDIKLYSLATLISAIAVFVTGTSLSIGVWMASLFILTGSFNGIQNSTYVRVLNGIYVSLLGYIHQRSDKENSGVNFDLKITSKEKNTGFILFTIVITILIVSLFSYLYAQANEQFEAWMTSLDFSFISFNWLVFTTLSFYVFKNITSTAELDLITTLERSINKNLVPPTQISQVKNERYAILGTVLISALCILISLFLIADISSIKQYAFQNGTELSKSVHEGVNALIVSIVLAITILLILFKGDFNFYKKNKTLKALSVLWIFLNIFLVIITAYKTHEYSNNFGLTYKRIGVIVYLLLCVSGLITAYLKIYRLKKIVFIFQTNAAVLFCLLLFLSTINWSRLVTSFNLSKIQNPDIHYLLTLDSSNSNLLAAYAKANPYIKQAPIISSRLKYQQDVLKDKSWKEFTLLNLKQ